MIGNRSISAAAEHVVASAFRMASIAHVFHAWPKPEAFVAVTSIRFFNGRVHVWIAQTTTRSLVGKTNRHNQYMAIYLWGIEPKVVFLRFWQLFTCPCSLTVRICRYAFI